MGSILTTITLVLKKHWLALVVFTLGAASVIGIYYKGQSDCRAAVEAATKREIERIMREVEEERSRLQDTRNKIKIDRQKNPINDERDTCILSGDPFKNKCV